MQLLSLHDKQILTEHDIQIIHRNLRWVHALLSLTSFSLCIRTNSKQQKEVTDISPAANLGQLGEGGEDGSTNLSLPRIATILSSHQSGGGCCCVVVYGTGRVRIKCPGLKRSVGVTMCPYAAFTSRFSTDYITAHQLVLVAQVRTAQSCFTRAPNPQGTKKLVYPDTQPLVNCRLSLLQSMDLFKMRRYRELVGIGCQSFTQRY